MFVEFEAGSASVPCPIDRDSMMLIPAERVLEAAD